MRYPRIVDRLVRASLVLRRGFRHGHGLFLIALLGGGLVFYGRSSWSALWLVGLITGLVLVATRIRSKLTEANPSEYLVAELGLLAALFLYAAELLGWRTLDTPLAPLAYVIVAITVAFAQAAEGWLAVAGLLALEAGVRRVTLREPTFAGLVVNGVFVLTFAVLNASFLRVEVARIRRHARARVEKELRRVREDARSYRLLGAGDSEAQNEKSEDRMTRSSVEEIHESVRYALELLRRTLKLHTAALLWLNESGTHLRISELSSDSDEIHDAPIAAGDGVLGAVVQHKEPVVLTNLTPSYKVPYYAGPNPTRVLTAIPVLEDGRVRGILVIDRTEAIPFTKEEEELAAQAAKHCKRAIDNERIFVQLERAKVEQGKLYRAAQSLGAATSEKAVLDAGVLSAREIASFDLAAVTIWDETAKMHEVCAATSANGEINDLVGARFQPNTGLVSMVVRNRFPLPYKGEFDPEHQVVLTKRFPWPKMPSLLVLPLVLHDRPLGTLILGAKRKHAFGDSVRPTLEVLASHLAMSLSNARMVQKLETMATTDGLTGLLNKRAMLDVGEQKIAAASRFAKRLSLLIIDIDHFKKVNDNYGHDIGDVVIQGLGAILKRQKRTTDVVARFGGEEFVVVCEETDEAGAILLGERIREDLKRTAFATPKGELKLTCSVGAATFGRAGRTWEELFKAADDALYTSKRGGRDRTTVWQPVKMRVGEKTEVTVEAEAADPSGTRVRSAKRARVA